MLRRFLMWVIIVALLCSTIYLENQNIMLQARIQSIAAENARLERRLAERTKVRGRREPSFAAERPVVVPSDPIGSAQAHLTRAEDAIAKGNIGDAITECRLAAADIQCASESSSAEVRNSVATLKQRLGSVEDQATGLWKQLGG